MLIYQIGKTSNSIEAEKVKIDLHYPKPIRFSDSTHQILAVRYSNFTNSDLSFLKWRSGFVIELGDIEQFVEARAKNEKTIGYFLMFFAGVPLLFSMLHLFIYYFNRNEIANLYYGILTLCFGGVNLIDLSTNYVSDPTWLKPLFIFSGVLAVLGIIFILLFAYESYKFRIPKHFILFIATGAILNVLLFLDIMLALETVIQIFAIISILEMIRVTMISLYIDKIKPGILTIGFTIFIVTWLYQVLTKVFNLPMVFELPIYYIGLLVLILSMSVHLSQNFAKVNRKLEKEIDTVKKLSKQKLERERITKERELEQKLLQADNKRKTKELEEARLLQLSMLPTELPVNAAFEVAASMNTATEVGGDYYDFYQNSGSELTFAIGDATGHGTKAGNMVSATKSLFNALVGNHTPLEMIQKFNNAIKLMNLPNLFMALLIAKFNNNKFIFSNSGMPPILVYKHGDKKVLEIKQKSMPLGGPANFPYTQSEFEVASGDLVLFSSDGFYEVFNNKEEMLGLEGAKRIFSDSVSDTPQTTINKILESIDHYSCGECLRDDLTLLLFKIK